MADTQDNSKSRAASVLAADAAHLSWLRRCLGKPIARLLHVYWRFARGLTVGARAVVIDGEGRVFLVKHSYIEGWHLPGGGVEAGESVLRALERELREEGNIELIGSPVMHGIYFNTAASRRDHVAVFVVRAYRQPSPPVRNREIVGHGFFTPNDLPAGTTRGTRERIAEVLQGKPPSGTW